MKIERIRNFVFVILTVIFAVLMCGVFGLDERVGMGISFTVLVWLAGAFFVLAVLQIVLTIKSRDTKLKKAFFLLTAISAACIPLFAVLHNVVYGLFFAGKRDGDEAVFFILALLVCPALFILGSLASVISGIVGMKNKVKNA